MLLGRKDNFFSGIPLYNEIAEKQWGFCSVYLQAVSTAIQMFVVACIIISYWTPTPQPQWQHCYHSGTFSDGFFMIPSFWRSRCFVGAGYLIAGCSCEWELVRKLSTFCGCYKAYTSCSTNSAMHQTFQAACHCILYFNHYFPLNSTHEFCEQLVNHGYSPCVCSTEHYVSFLQQRHCCFLVIVEFSILGKGS